VDLVLTDEFCSILEAAKSLPMFHMDTRCFDIPLNVLLFWLHQKEIRKKSCFWR